MPFCMAPLFPAVLSACPRYTVPRIAARYYIHTLSSRLHTVASHTVATRAATTFCYLTPAPPPPPPHRLPRAAMVATLFAAPHCQYRLPAFVTAPHCPPAAPSHAYHTPTWRLFALRYRALRDSCHTRPRTTPTCCFCWTYWTRLPLHPPPCPTLFTAYTALPHAPHTARVLPRSGTTRAPLLRLPTPRTHLLPFTGLLLVPADSLHRAC